jgi:hypothetical protein
MKRFHTHRMGPMRDGCQHCVKCHKMFRDKNFGDKFELKDFMEQVKNGNFIPYDGSIGEIYVNDKLTNIEVQGWGYGLASQLPEIYGPIVMMTLEELAAIKDKVTLMWYNK